MRRILAVIFAGSLVAVFAFSMRQEAAEAKPVGRIPVKEITHPQDRERAEFSAPVAIVSDQGLIYVIDSQECEIRVFSAEGRYLRAFGGKGQGPGEFNSPSDLDFFDGQVYLADRFNRRVQVLDKDGRYVRSFRVPLNPEHICVLARERIVVTQLPLGISAEEKLIHCFDLKGNELWQREDAFFSGDRVYDTFRNFAILEKGNSDDAYLVRKCNERRISHFDKDGRSLGPIIPSQGYPLTRLNLPLSGKNKLIEGFCWDGRFFRDEFFLMAPESTREGDLGPGRSVFVIGLNGRMGRVIDLPARVKKIAVSADRIFAIDTENNLRVFAVETK